VGALAGHMDHLYDNPSLTFSKMKEIFQAAATGELKGTEKTDGQNLYISYSVKDGKAKAARNKGNIKEGGLDAKGLAAKFSEHPNPQLILTFTEAFRVFEKAARSFPPGEQANIFGPDANIFYNAEIQDPRASNVINYDTKNLVIHRSGHAEFDRETAKITDRDVSRNASILETALAGVQDQLAMEDYGVQVNAIRVLKALDDHRYLDDALQRLEAILNKEGISDNQTIADFLISRVDNIIKHQVKLPSDTQEELLRRIMKQPSTIKKGKNASVRTILSTLPKEDEETISIVRQLVDDAKIILKTAIDPIEDIVHDFTVEMLRGLESAFLLDNEREVDRLKTEVGDAIDTIQQSGSEAAIGILNQQLRKLKDVENVSTAAEGFVFDYDGHTYKFTGNFAPINQILGLFKYGREGIPPMQISEALKSQKADIALYPGAFKPPHKGHLEVIKQLLKQAKKVIILISNPLGATRKMPISGRVIDASDAEEVWKKYIKGLNNVEIQVSADASPLTATFTYISGPVSGDNSSAPEGATVILGCGDKGSDMKRYASAYKYARKDVNVSVFGCPLDAKHGSGYVNMLVSSPHIYNKLPSIKKGLDPADFHASDMRYIADLSLTDEIAAELFQDFVPEGVNSKNILSILGAEKKSPIMETLFSLVEGCIREITEEKKKTQVSKAGQKRVSRKIAHLIDKEGKSNDQAAAIAHSMEEEGDLEEQTEPFQKFARGTYVKMVGDLATQGPNKYNVGGKMKKVSNKHIKSAPPGGGAMEEAIEEEKELEEMSSMAGGDVQGAPAAQGGPWPRRNIEKDNEEEKKRSKLKMKKALVEEESIIEEIANYLLQMPLVGAK